LRRCSGRRRGRCSGRCTGAAQSAALPLLEALISSPRKMADLPAENIFEKIG